MSECDQLKLLAVAMLECIEEVHDQWEKRGVDEQCLSDMNKLLRCARSMSDQAMGKYNED